MMSPLPLYPLFCLPCADYMETVPCDLTMDDACIHLPMFLSVQLHYKCLLSRSTKGCQAQSSEKYLTTKQCCGCSAYVGLECVWIL